MDQQGTQPYDALPSTAGSFPQATPAPTPAPAPAAPEPTQQPDAERAEEVWENKNRGSFLGLRPMSWLGTLGLVLLVTMMMLIHKGGVMTPLILIPSIGFFVWCTCKKRDIEDIDLLVRKYYSGLFVGTVVVIILQAICLYSLIFLFFVVRGVPPSMFVVHAFFATLIFTYVFVEEAFKFVVAHGRSSRADAIFRQRAAEAEAGVGNRSDLTDPMPDSRLYLLYSLASTAGLATGSMFFWWTVLILLNIEEDDDDLFKIGLITLIVITGLVFIYHMLTGYLIGLRLARRREERRAAGSDKAGKRWYSILWFPVLARIVSLLLFVHGSSVLDRDFGWLLSFISIIALVFVIKREERKMPATYLRQVGYMTAFGYGALPTSDEEAGQMGLEGLDIDGPDMWLDAEDSGL